MNFILRKTDCFEKGVVEVARPFTCSEICSILKKKLSSRTERQKNFVLLLRENGIILTTLIQLTKFLIVAQTLPNFAIILFSRHFGIVFLRALVD